MKTYFALVHKEADSAFGISFPDIPGCFSAADNEDDVFSQAQAALTLFASDEQELPASRSISQLRADPEVQAEVSDGAFLISVPLIIVSRKLRYNLMLGADLVAGVDATARVLGVSRSEFVSEAISERLRGQSGAVLLRQTSSGRLMSAYKGAGTKGKKAVAASALTQAKSKTETTSAEVASSASKIMRSKTASKEAKSVAASALTQKTKKK